MLQNSLYYNMFEVYKIIVLSTFISVYYIAHV